MSRWMAVAALLAAMAAATAATAADKLVLQLHGPAQFEFAGYYAALWQGYYRDAGLAVTIKPGAGVGEAPIDPVREVADGRAQFGTGTADLVVRTAQGLPLLLLAPIFQTSGAAVYYRADEDFASPDALAKAKLGRLPASNILDIELATALHAEGINPKTLNAVPLQPRDSLAALADRRVDAVPGSAWELPWLAYQKGIALKSFNPADYRVDFYGDTLFTLRQLATTQPDIVRRFRDASLKGWDYALKHPDEITALLISQLPHPPGIADIGGFARYQAALARRLARFPAVALGHSNPERWDRIEAAMTASGALLRTADADEFVYDPDAAARHRTDRRDFAILGGTLAAALVVIGWLGLRWRRRAAPATAKTAARPAAATLKAAPEPIPADLNAVLTRLERRMRQRVPRGVAFRLSLLPELWRCRAEAATVRRLVLDLVAAAVADLRGAGLKGAGLRGAGLKSSGELIVGTRNYAFDAAAVADTPSVQLGDWVRVTVRDSGAGLTEEALARVFDPAATSRPSAAVAAAAMHTLGGFVRVESAEGIGTAIHLYFPRAAASAATPGKPAEAAA